MADFAINIVPASVSLGALWILCAWQVHFSYLFLSTCTICFGQYGINMVPEKVSVLGIKCKFIVFCSVSVQIYR